MALGPVDPLPEGPSLESTSGGSPTSPQPELQPRQMASPSRHGMARVWPAGVTFNKRVDSVLRYGAILDDMAIRPLRTVLFLAASLSACRSGSAPAPADSSSPREAGDVVARAEPAGDAGAQKVYEEDFQFTIDGMRRINGAL